MRNMICNGLSLLAVCFLFGFTSAQAQAVIEEKLKTIKTYPFSDPDPVPKVGRVYPYFRFDGYTKLPVMKDWKLVELQNPYIRVTVTPEIGGKIWGAYLKPSPNGPAAEPGFPFVYYNNVVKFRDVAMRGAWTSGGIEINFGDIGHDPTIATPVDYVTRTNADGSVSCFVGAWDWASRTRWTVEINLPKDKAFFTTQSRWFNASPLDQTYYHWMNAGFRAAGNLEFIFPGTNFIGHGGEPGNWPVNEEGRNINFYEQNNFGSYKSYHVLGKTTDFFGGYWHNDRVGFVRYSPYHEKLGKKIWVWGLSRQGMIWEKLLTDNDGQYVELQSGRLFNQAADNSINSPFKHVAFPPYASDSWTEHWYPVKNTGWSTTANQLGALNLRKTATHLVWTFCPVQAIEEKFAVRAGEELIFEKKISLRPIENYTDSVAVNPNPKLVVFLGNTRLLDQSRSEETERPLTAPADFDWSSEYGLYLKGKDLSNQRQYAEAEEWLYKCLQKNAYFLPALSELAQLNYRKGLYEESLNLADKALSVNTYDPMANFFRGLSAFQLGRLPVAKDGFSVAALSPLFRAAALTEMARIAILENDLAQAERFVAQALEDQPSNDHARHLQLILLRKNSRVREALNAATELLAANPLDHFADFERALVQNKKDFGSAITNELPREDYIEMAIWYAQAGLFEEAGILLAHLPQHPIGRLWGLMVNHARSGRADLARITNTLKSDPRFVFPFRQEEVAMLKKAEELLQASGEAIPWQLHYYQGILLWQLGRISEAKEHLSACGDTPDFAPFYMARAELFRDQSQLRASSVERAYALAPDDWRVAKTLADMYAVDGQLSKALEVNEKLAGKSNLAFHEVYILGQQRARLLYQSGRYKGCIDLMKSLDLLPNEGARDAHDLFRSANIRQAIELTRQKKYKAALDHVKEAETWPENLGSGEPYDPDNRLTGFMKKALEGKMRKGASVIPESPELNDADKELLEAFLRNEKN